MTIREEVIIKPIAIFPTHIWLEQIGQRDLGITNEQMCAHIDKLIGQRPSLQPGRSWQTDQVLHKEAIFKPLAQAFLRTCESVLNEYQVKYEGVEVTGCWANISPAGSVHTPHTHPNNYLSGVYYPRAPKGGNHIAFHRPEASSSSIRPAVKQLNAFNSSEVVVQVNTGDLIIFPSTLMHSVPPNGACEERVSIAMNMMFSDFAQTIAPPIWEGIQLRQ